MIVEIQPQMSFGTGHHQTTWLMSKALFELESIPEKVLDMGTGTGVLAIIVEKLGAKSILAIDIEDWSVVNAIENSERNGCKNINQFSEFKTLKSSYDKLKRLNYKMYQKSIPNNY